MVFLLSHAHGCILNWHFFVVYEYRCERAHENRFMCWKHRVAIFHPHFSSYTHPWVGYTATTIKSSAVNIKFLCVMLCLYWFQHVYNTLTVCACHLKSEILEKSIEFCPHGILAHTKIVTLRSTTLVIYINFRQCCMFRFSISFPSTFFNIWYNNMEKSILFMKCSTTQLNDICMKHERVLYASSQ